MAKNNYTISPVVCRERDILLGGYRGEEEKGEPKK
jgi:hypothetical protein